VHGHNFVAEIHVTGDLLNESGLLIDFNEFKDSVKAWIDKMWDHAFLVNDYDDKMCGFLALNDQRHFRLDPLRMCEVYGISFETAEPETLREICNPTVENLSMLLREVVQMLFKGRGFANFEVTLYESPSGWVTTRSE
jgi:6-pyruvoyl-tetrahydropterin synthase